MSHFMSCCRQNPGPIVGIPQDPPGSLPSPAHWPQGVSLDTLGLARMPCRKDGTAVSDPSKAEFQIQLKSTVRLVHADLNMFIVFQIDWAANIRKSWDFSEEGAHARLEAFLQDGEAPCSLETLIGVKCGTELHHD